MYGTGSSTYTYHSSEMTTKNMAEIMDVGLWLKYKSQTNNILVRIQ